MKKTLLLLLAFTLLMTNVLTGQNSSVPGYVIESNGDTTKGYINKDKWDVTPDEIYFSETPDPAQWRKLNSGLIRGFGTREISYISEQIQVEVSPVQIQSLQKDPAFNLVTRRAFIETIYKGDKCLYSYVKPDISEQFYIKTDSGIHLLLYKKYIRYIPSEARYANQENYNVTDGKPIIAENRTFVGQLTQYFSNVEGIISQLYAIEYTEKELRKIFDFYYKQTSKAPEYVKERVSIKPEFGIRAGAGLMQLKFKGDGWDNLVNMDDSFTPVFIGGVFVDIPFSRGQARWIIANDLLFTSYNIKQSSVVADGPNNVTTSDMEIAHSYAKVFTRLKYRIPLNKCSFHVNGGVSNGFMLSEKNHLTTTRRFYETETTEEGKVTDESRKWELGFTAGVGMKVSKFSVDAFIESGNGFSAYSALTSKTTRICFMIGYTIL